MEGINKILLSVTGIAALYTILVLARRRMSHRSGGPATLYYITSLGVIFASVLLLAIFGWKILGLMGDGVSNNAIAVIASLIPFSWASGVVAQNHPKSTGLFTATMVLGIILISISRFMDMPLFARIIYPVFHGSAGLTIIILPIIAVVRGSMKRSYIWMSFGGLLISTGGIALAFITAGRQLLFFSQDIVLAILAPLLLITTLAYSFALISGDSSDSL